MVIGSTSQQCSTDGFSFGSPWDDIIEDCCTDIREADDNQDNPEESETFCLMFPPKKKMKLCISISTENICQQINNLCTQICEPTQDNSYVCKCHDDYELLEDNITCVKKTDVIDNEISTTHTTSIDVSSDNSNSTKYKSKFIDL